MEAGINVYNAHELELTGPMATQPLVQIPISEYGTIQSGNFRTQDDDIAVLVYIMSGKTQQQDAGVFYIDNLKVELIESSITYTCESSTPETQIGSSYRYQYNGMENDDEVSGKGRHPQFGDFGYDPATGRRWNNDPITYPWQSPYATFNNNPIFYMDPTGKQGKPGKMLQSGVYSPATSSTYIKPATSKDIQFKVELQLPYKPTNEDGGFNAEAGIEYKGKNASIDLNGKVKVGAKKGGTSVDYDVNENELNFNYNNLEYSKKVSQDNTTLDMKYGTQLIGTTTVFSSRGFMFDLGVPLAGYSIGVDQHKYVVTLEGGAKFERTVNEVTEKAAWLGRKVERKIFYDVKSGDVLSDQYRDIIEVGASKKIVEAKLTYTTEWKDFPNEMKDYRQNNYYKPVKDEGN